MKTIKETKDEVLTLLSKIHHGSELELINGLCDRAKMYVLDYLLTYGNPKSVRELALTYDAYNSKLSPIEQIFQVVYFQYISALKIWQIENLKYIDDYVPTLLLFLTEFTSKKEILCKNKKYVADFILDFSRKYTSGDQKGEYIYPKLNNLKYIIKLDSARSPRSKYQINCNYDMENNLKELGYTLVKFTDTMVYDDPYSCVDKLITIIFKDIKRLKDTNI